MITTVSVPLETPRSALAPHVGAAVHNLFTVFGGMEFEGHLIEEIVEDALQIWF